MDWVGVDEGMARTIMMQGETYLKAQLDISLASDRRAMTLASTFVTLATAVLGASVAYFTQRGTGAVLVGGLITSAAMLAGAAIAFWAGRPINFYAPGSYPSMWWAGRRELLAEMLGGQSENYQIQIEHNEQCLAANARALELGARLATIAPVLGFVAWCISLYLSTL